MIANASNRWRWIYQHQTKDRKRRSFFIFLFATVVLWILYWHAGPSFTHEEFPLVDQYIQNGRGDGGRWYIPQAWIEDSRSIQKSHKGNLDHYMDVRNPRSPAEAAQFSLELCLRRKMFINNTKIPLIVHQTWKDSDASTWKLGARRGAEEWLRAASGLRNPDLPQFAYIFWDDNAVKELINVYEKDLITHFHNLPYAVEKADVFRVAVLKWFGGIYADIDTSPLLHPSQWVYPKDLNDWTDAKTNQKYSLRPPPTESYSPPASAPFRPRPLPDSAHDLTPASYTKWMSLYKPTSVDIAAIVGIEADTPDDTDAYWRSGYTYPVQLTNWAMAMAPHHPIGINFLTKVASDIRLNMSRLHYIDPVTLSGPVALTSTVKDIVGSDNPKFVWQSLSSIGEPRGGSAKVVAGDILVLPITGFSPGRSMNFHNMGSEPITHPNARLAHIAQGSWRGTSIKVEAGKFCRTFLGGCREWSKIPI